ncbi:MAG: MG2 domain-containing protein [Planctomycetes bacterium]|nr:MG2 domain-containing protein [Planctomycetota bacterium]
MNRILFLGNVVLALVLLVRLLFWPQPAAALALPEPVAAAVRVEPQQARDGAVTSLVLQLGADFGPLGAGREPVELGIRLDPPVPVLTRWLTPHSVAVVPAQPLPASRQQRVVFAQALETAGKRIAAGTIVAFATSRLALQHVVLADDDGAAAAAGVGIDELPPCLRLTFDQPIGAEAAGKWIVVREAGQPERIVPVQVVLPPDQPTSTSVLLRLSGDTPPEVVEVVLAAELTAAGGEVPLGRVVTERVRWREPLRWSGLGASELGLELAFTHELPLPLDGQLRVQPAVPFQVRRSDGGLRLLGEWAPGSVVTVELPEGFPGRGRHRLAAPTRRSLLLPDRQPKLEFAHGGQVLCASALPQLELKGCNSGPVRARLQRVYANNLVRALQRADGDAFAPASAVEVPIRAERNEDWAHVLDLQALAGGPLRGLYRLELWHGEHSYWPQRRWLQVTDLGVTWRAGRESAIVHVRDLVSGGPVAEATVSLLTPTNQVLANGRTDAAGLLQVEWRHTGADQVPFVVLAQRGEDVAFASRDGDAVELAEPELGGRAYAGEGLEAWVWADQGIVRPGSTIDVVTVVRDGRGLPAPAGALRLRFVGPNGRAVAEPALVGSGSGLMHAPLALALDAPMGVYRAEVIAADSAAVLGSTTFRVEAFVPDRLEVEVLAVSALRFGGTGTVGVRGRWLDGSPAAGRRVALRLRLQPHAATFASAPGFTFAAAGDGAGPGELPLVEGSLDADGRAELEFMLPPDAEPQTLLAHVAVELQDPSGRVVRAAAQAPVLRRDFHLGLSAAPGRCELRVVDADGAAVAGAQAAVVRLERRSWRWLYEPVRGGRWRWRTTREAATVGEWNVTLQDGAVVLPLPAVAADGDGDPVVVATVGGRRVEQALHEPTPRPDRLRVQGPSEPVAAGSAAQLLVTTPAAGRALVTIESDRLHGAQSFELQRGQNRIDVVLPPGLQLPNVHAVVTLTRPVPQSGPDLGPAWLVGGAPIRLARPELALSLQLDAPAAMRPDADWVAGLDCPGATLAAVALVDEGVLRVTGHQDPDPLAFLLANRALSTDGADNGASLLQRMQFAAGTKTGGDGDDDEFGGLLAGAVDSRIRPFAKFVMVPLDAAGRGNVRVPVGGYEGRLRAMVIAAGAVGVAAARAETIVQAPLGVQVAVPRMVAPGDRFTLPITVRSQLAPGPVTVRVIAAAALQLEGPAVHELVLATGGEATIELPLLALAPAVGESLAQLRIVAEATNERREITAEFTVRTATVVARETIGVDLATGGELEIGPAWQQVTASVQLDRRPERLLAPVLLQLLDYPYGCAEQTMSKGMALLSCRAMLPRLLAADDVRLGTADAMVQAAIDRLLGMQSFRGGFGWWGGSDDAPFVTAYVTEFLVVARERGLDVHAASFELALERCAALLQQSDDVGLRCLLVDVLTRAGRPVQPWLDWLSTAATATDDRLRLATALGRLGQRERAAELLVLDDERLPPRAAAGDLVSPLRSQALRVRALLTIDAARPDLPALARALQRSLLREATTTQEQWQGLRALAEYYALQPVATEAPAATLSIDGAARELTGDRQSLDVRAGSTIRFAAGGRGFAVVELRGLRTPDSQRRDGGIHIERTLVDVATGATVTRGRRGRIYEVRLVVQADASIEHLALVDLLPGGLEPEPAGPGDTSAMAGHVLRADQEQRGDDRVLFFCRRTEAKFELRHRVRATFPGTYADPGAQAEAMYEPGSWSSTGPGAALVIEP